MRQRWLRFAIVGALVVVAGHEARAEQCTRVTKLTEPCEGRLLPNHLYLELWRDHDVELPRVRLNLAICKRDARTAADRAADKLTRERNRLGAKLASCDRHVMDLEAALERKFTPAPRPLVESPILWGIVGAAIGIGAGLLIGVFGL